MKQNAYLKTFTPQECEEILNRGGHNRPLDNKRVERYAQAMKQKLWVVNGETIIFNGKALVDGQHRLWACIEAQTPFTSWVIEGVDANAFETIDTGKVRNTADAVAIESETVKDMSTSARSAMSSAIRLILACGSDRLLNVGRLKMLTNHDAVQFLKANGDIIDDSKELMSWGRWPLPASHAIMLYWIVKNTVPQAKDLFFRRLQNGSELNAENPILLLRNKGMSNPKASDFRTSRDQIGNLIKVWNAWLTNDKIKTLRFSSGTEAFPSILMSKDDAVKRAKRMGKKEKKSQ